MKKFLLVLLIIVIIFIAASVLLYVVKNKDEIKEKIEIPQDKFFSIDNNFNLTVKKDYSFKEISDTSDFLLALTSKDNLNINIYISRLTTSSDLELNRIIKADMSYYPSNFEDVSKLSEIKQISLNSDIFGNYYDFNYIDQNTSETYYLQSIFLNINDAIYNIDIDYPLNNSQEASLIVNDILSTITKK